MELLADGLGVHPTERLAWQVDARGDADAVLPCHMLDRLGAVLGLLDGEEIADVVEVVVTRLGERHREVDLAEATVLVVVEAAAGTVDLATRRLEGARVVDVLVCPHDPVLELGCGGDHLER